MHTQIQITHTPTHKYNFPSTLALVNAINWPNMQATLKSAYKQTLTMQYTQTNKQGQTASTMDRSWWKDAKTDGRRPATWQHTATAAGTGTSCKYLHEIRQRDLIKNTGTVHMLQQPGRMYVCAGPRACTALLQRTEKLNSITKQQWQPFKIIEIIRRGILPAHKKRIQ